MLFSLAERREGERVPELPLAPLLKDTPKRSLRGRCATRMAALGGANLRPASAGGAAWKISFGSSRPWRAAPAVRQLHRQCASGRLHGDRSIIRCMQLGCAHSSLSSSRCCQPARCRETASEERAGGRCHDTNVHGRKPLELVLLRAEGRAFSR